MHFRANMMRDEADDAFAIGSREPLVRYRSALLLDDRPIDGHRD